MAGERRVIAVFAKPWKGMEVAHLAEHVRSLGFESIELPVRPGFAVEPEQVGRELPAAVAALRSYGVDVVNVTADLPLDREALYAACAEAGVHMNRVMFRRGGLPYWGGEAAARRQLDKAVPFCERYGVRIGVQQHSGAFVPINAMGLHHLLEPYDPQHVGAIWDAAHCALQGEDPATGLEIVRSHLCMVNLKNAYWQRTTGPEAATAAWRPYYTSGRHGLSSWPAVAEAVRAVDYQGPVTLSAEYSAEHEVDRLAAADLTYAKELFA